MKYSGIDWIGNIPDNWSLRKIGQLFNLRNEKVSDTVYAPLSVAKGGVVPQMDSVAKSDASDDRKLVLKGDFVINSRSDRKQSCGVSALNGSVSLINTVLYPKDNNFINNQYLDYLLKNYGFAEEFYRWGHGIVADLWTTRWQEMKNIIIPIPTLKIQEQLNNYISIKVDELLSLISNEKKQIELLLEYKKSLINNATIKGLLNCNCINVDQSWVKTMPENWNLAPLKGLFDFGKGLPITKDDLIESGIKVISYGQIHSKKNSSATIVADLFRFVSPKFLESNPECLVGKGDFIFADTSEDIDGSGDFVFIDKEDQIFAGYHSIILKSKVKTNVNKYFAYLFMSPDWKTQIQSRVSGVKLFSISKSILSKTTVFLPSIDEQYSIVAFLDDKCEAIDELIEIKKNKIKKLEEYKKSLIYECVTGKKEAAHEV